MTTIQLLSHVLDALRGPYPIVYPPKVFKDRQLSDPPSDISAKRTVWNVTLAVHDPKHTAYPKSIELRIVQQASGLRGGANGDGLWIEGYYLGYHCWDWIPELANYVGTLVTTGRPPLREDEREPAQVLQLVRPEDPR